MHMLASKSKRIKMKTNQKKNVFEYSSQILDYVFVQ